MIEDSVAREMRPPLSVRLGLAAMVALAACYTLVFVMTGEDSWASALLDALINVMPIGLWGALFFELNRRWLLDRRLPVQIPLQLVCAFAFAFVWYFSVTILLGWRAGDFASSFSVRPFASIAFVWQMFQGAVTYMLVAALALVDRLAAALRDARAADPVDVEAAPASERRILVRGEDGLLAVAVDEIAAIERAGDYVQLITADGRHLTRRSLAELERQLPGESFIRVHRSCLINLAAFEAAESIGGGRMRIRLRGGVAIDTSRSGARALRERAG
jgi:hypothetical protein